MGMIPLFFYSSRLLGESTKKITRVNSGYSRNVRGDFKFKNRQ